jgi:Uma2 family endonuclease
MTITTPVSVEEYVALPAREAGYEYDEGRVIEMPAPTLPHAIIQMQVGWLFRKFIESAKLNFVVAGPTGFWLTPAIERVPDVSLIQGEKIASMDIFHGSLRGAPDIAMEIISATETASDLDRKVDQYLKAGVRAVVLVYPETRHVQLYGASGEARRLGPGEALEIPEVLPGFKVTIDRIIDEV